MDEALTELILKAGTQLTLSAIRAHLSRDPGVVDSAIEKTDRQFPGAEPALGRWVSTESFDHLLARVAAGDHEVIDDAAIRSFVEEGDYYMPNAADAMEAAKPIVTALLGAVLTGLLEGDQGTPVLANRMEWQHEETMAELRELRVSVDQLAAQPASTQSATSMSLAKPGCTDRSLKGRAAGLPERSAGVPAFAGRCRSEEPSLSVAQRGSGALRAPARGCARRARACWREPRTRVGAVSERQAGSGNARNRARAAAHWPAQGQRFARCRVQRRAEWVSRPARAK